MGKGDKKSKKGKITIGSFGVTRKKKAKNKNNITMAGALAGVGTAAKKSAKKEGKPAAKKEAAPKKAAAKKTEAAPKKAAKKEKE